MWRYTDCLRASRATSATSRHNDSTWRGGWIFPESMALGPVGLASDAVKASLGLGLETARQTRLAVAWWRYLTRDTGAHCNIFMLNMYTRTSHALKGPNETIHRAFEQTVGQRTQVPLPCAISGPELRLVFRSSLLLILPRVAVVSCVALVGSVVVVTTALICSRASSAVSGK